MNDKNTLGARVVIERCQNGWLLHSIINDRKYVADDLPELFRWLGKELDPFEDKGERG